MKSQCDSSPDLAEQQQTAADPQTKPADLGHDCLQAAIIRTHHGNWILLSPKFDIHFTFARTVEG